MPEPTERQIEFAVWVRERATDRGYDMSPRGGGATRLAHDARLSLTAVTRLLSAEREPTLTVLRRLAPVLRTSLRDLLVMSGLATEAELDGAVPEPEPEEDPVIIDIRASALDAAETEEMIKIYRQQRQEYEDGLRRSWRVQLDAMNRDRA